MTAWMTGGGGVLASPWVWASMAIHLAMFCLRKLSKLISSGEMCLVAHPTFDAMTVKVSAKPQGVT